MIVALLFCIENICLFFFSIQGTAAGVSEHASAGLQFSCQHPSSYRPDARSCEWLGGGGGGGGIPSPGSIVVLCSPKGTHNMTISRPVLSMRGEGGGGGARAWSFTVLHIK